MSAPVGFLVWNPERGFPTYTHHTFTRALEEAERLKREHSGQRFFVMAPVTTMTEVSHALGWSRGREEGEAQRRQDVMQAERNSDAAQDRLRRLQPLEADASTHQAIVADALLWFDGFAAAHAPKDSWERPHLPDRERLRKLNEALQRLLPDAGVHDDDIPF